MFLFLGSSSSCSCEDENKVVCFSLTVLVWKHEVSLQPLPSSLFLASSFSSFFLLPSNRAVGSKVSLLPASLSLSSLPAWSQERAQGLQREYGQCCVSLFEHSLPFFPDSEEALSSIHQACSLRERPGPRRGKSRERVLLLSIPVLARSLASPFSFFSQPVSFTKAMKPEKRRSSARSRAQRQARFGWVAVSSC